MKYVIPAKSINDSTADFEITAYNTDVPGLVAHRSIEGFEENITIGNAWDVTHAKSGRAINPYVFKLRKDAKEYARCIAHLADWEKDRDVLYDIGGLRDALESICLDVANQ